MSTRPPGSSKACGAAFLIHTRRSQNRCEDVQGKNFPELTRAEEDAPPFLFASHFRADVRTVSSVPESNSRNSSGFFQCFFAKPRNKFAPRIVLVKESSLRRVAARFSPVPAGSVLGG